MYVHHLLTIFLYSHSYLIQRTQEGALIMFIHCIADIPCSFARAFVETDYSTPTALSAVAMAVSWAYSRLYVFPKLLLVIYWSETIYKGTGFISERYSLVSLTTLFILHVYWFGILMKSLSKYVLGGGLKDDQ